MSMPSDRSGPVSDEERVQAKYPAAKCLRPFWSETYIVRPFLCGGIELGIGPTESAAWADAARRLEREHDAR